jgi:hypothetical protein
MARLELYDAQHDLDCAIGSADRVLKEPAARWLVLSANRRLQEEVPVMIASSCHGVRLMLCALLGHRTRSGHRCEQTIPWRTLEHGASNH